MKIAGSELARSLDSVRHNKTGFENVSGSNRQQTFLQLGLVALIAVVYLANLTPEHVFVNDDFAAYVMHSANVVEGRSYTAINYVPNPQALWLAPSNGYPPVYPLLLAPAYKIWGLNLRALKVVTVLCFVGFLVIFAELMRPTLSPLMSCCALLILGFNPVFWEHRNVLLSEFPYLMFSFGALLAIQRVYKDLTADEVRIGMIVFVSILIYLTYGIRTIGIVLLPALVLADVLKFRKPSRFLIGVFALTAVLIAVQTLFLASPKGYLSAVELSPRAAASNAIFYAKTLSYVWSNGFSKKLQIGFALAFTALAAAGFTRRVWTNRSAGEFYLLGYVAILISWSAEIGMRGLLPILPLYFVCALEGFGRIVHPLGRLGGTVSLTVVLLLVGFTYAGAIGTLSRKPAEPNVRDSTAQEMFIFLRANTQPAEVLVFPKPRTLALFTNRRVASLAPNEMPEDSFQFMKSIHAPILVKPKWSPLSWQSLLDSHIGHPVEVFHNSEYQVFRMRMDEDSQAPSSGADKQTR
jgi:hypothetical protein